MFPFFKTRLDSFRCAWNGISYVFRTETNMKIHLAIAIFVVAVGFVLHISLMEWGILALCIGLVLAAELFNTAIERFVDFVEPQRDARVGLIKDIAAGGVLLCAIAAAVVGFIVFLPKIIALLA